MFQTGNAAEMRRISFESGARRFDGKKNVKGAPDSCLRFRGIEYAIISFSGILSYISLAIFSVIFLFIALMKDSVLAHVEALLEQQHMVNKDINVDEMRGSITEHYAAFALCVFFSIALMSIPTMINAAAMHTMVNKRFADQPDKNRCYFRAHFCSNAVMLGLALLACVLPVCISVAPLPMATVGQKIFAVAVGSVVSLLTNAGALFSMVLLLWASNIAGAQFEESRVAVMGAAEPSYGAVVGAPVEVAVEPQQEGCATQMV